MKRPSATDAPTELFRSTPQRRLILLKAAWPVAVGPELARRSEVVALDGARARIRVTDATWRRSLWRMRGDLLDRLRRVAGAAAPYALSFVEGPVEPPAPRLVPRIRAVEPAPLPPALSDAVERISDEATRTRFRASAGRYLARFAPQTTPDEDGPS